MEMNAKRVSTKIEAEKSASPRAFCEVCGKPSQVPICGFCSDKIRAEALARKRREDQGLE